MSESTPQDFVRWRKTFSRGKSDGTLDRLAILVWIYRLAALVWAAYFGYLFGLNLSICGRPTWSISTPSSTEYGPTFCEAYSEAGVLHLYIIWTTYYGLIALLHLGAVVLTALILRWRQQWLYVYDQPTAKPAFHPDKLFAGFTSLVLLNVAILLFAGLYDLGQGGLLYGAIFTVISLLGVGFLGYLLNRLWALDIHRPAKNAQTSYGGTPATQPQYANYDPSQYQAYNPVLVTNPPVTAAPGAANHVYSPQMAQTNGGYVPPQRTSASYGVYSPQGTQPQPAVQYVYTNDPSLAGKTV